MAWDENGEKWVKYGPSVKDHWEFAEKGGSNFFFFPEEGDPPKTYRGFIWMKEIE